MNEMLNDAFWKAVSETAVTRGIIDAAVVVYCRANKMTVSECCSVVGLGAKRVKSILSEFDRYSATRIPFVASDKMSA